MELTINLFIGEIILWCKNFLEKIPKHLPFYSIYGVCCIIFPVNLINHCVHISTRRDEEIKTYIGFFINTKYFQMTGVETFL